VAEGSSERASIRQVIASLLRLADADARDAQLLADAGSERNASVLLRNAVSRLIEVVVASEQGHAGPAETGRIDARNPLKARLMALDSLPADPPALLRDGRLSDPPAAASLEGAFGELRTALSCLARHFGVDTESTGPAATAEPLRSVVPASPPARKHAPAPASPKPGRQPPVKAGPAAKASTGAAGRPADTAPARQEAEDGEPHERPTPHVPAGLSSGIFWSLVDHWGLPDLDALALIGHAGGLTRKGTRPRFKLTEKEAEVVAAMRSLDAALGQLGLDPAKWLLSPLRPEPFGGRPPLDVIRTGRLEGLRAVSRHVVQMGLRLSLKQA
jgi:hypothetical protein